jgi:WD40 repeat protein
MLFSPDGQWLFHMTSDAKTPVCMRHGATGKEQATLDHGTYLASAPLAVSPDSKTLATVCVTSIFLWDIPGAQRRELVNRSKVLFSAGMFTVDGKKLRTIGTQHGVPKGTLDLIAQLWDVATGKELESRVLQSAKTVQVPSISPDGRFLAFAPPLAPDVDVIDLEMPDKPTALAHKPKNVDRLVFSPDGKSLATLGRDGKLIVWDVASGAATAECQFRVLPNRWLFLAYSGDGKCVAVTTPEGVMRCEPGQSPR